MKKLKFEELNLSEKTLKAVREMGFEEASPIQGEAIPPILAGKDVIGQAQTGTGKTAAFAIPIIEKVDFENKELQAMVLCPTRELVIQVTEEFRKLFKYHYNLSIVPVYGGQEIERQIFALKKKPQIIVGTPGRLMDHMRRATVKLGSLRFVVLDEADEMLNMGFREDMEVILKDTPSTRQTVMFSATINDDITGLMKRYQKNPVNIDVTCHKINAPKIAQYYYDITEAAKPEALARLIDYHRTKLALVFCNTKQQVDILVENLKNMGYPAEGLHGDMSQNQRLRVMKSFKDGGIEILVATDVAGRGIDVNDIEAVFNYDLPRDDEDYVHRIGRTARAGKSGKAFTFVVGRQFYNLKRIQAEYELDIKRSEIPSTNDMDGSLISYYSEEVGKIIKEGSLTRYQKIAEAIMGNEYASIDLAAALLKIAAGQKFEESDDKFKPAYPTRSTKRSYETNDRNYKPRQSRNKFEHGDAKKSNGDFRRSDNKKKSQPDHFDKFKNKKKYVKS